MMEQIPYLPAGVDKSEMTLPLMLRGSIKGEVMSILKSTIPSMALPVTPFILVIVYLLVNMVCLWEDMTLRILV